MDRIDSAAWRKSTYSGGNGGNCVEIAGTPGLVLVRDTQDRDGAMLSVPPDAWMEFTASLR